MALANQQEESEIHMQLQSLSKGRHDSIATKFLKWLGTDFGKTGWEGEVTFLPD